MKGVGWVIKTVGIRGGGINKGWGTAGGIYMGWGTAWGIYRGSNKMSVPYKLYDR